jgi:hypothetical protein
MVFAIDKYGRNQCTALNINNITTSLTYKDSSLRPRSETSSVTLKTISATSSASITSVGTIQSLAATKKTFCTKFSPVIDEEGINDTTVISNTYMSYVLPPYCDD